MSKRKVRYKSADTELLIAVAEQVNGIGAGDSQVAGELAIHGHLQSLVDDPDGETVTAVADVQTEQAMAASLPMIAQGGTGAYQLFLTSLWLDGFLIGAEYGRQRKEK